MGLLGIKVGTRAWIADRISLQPLVGRAACSGTWAGGMIAEKGFALSVNSGVSSLTRVRAVIARSESSDTHNASSCQCGRLHIIVL
jgi:hypothetical protein